MAYPAMGRKYGITNDGTSGLFPSDAQIGDHICVLLGLAVPFVIRKVPNAEGCCTMVGECCLDGLMDESALVRDSSRVQELTLV